MIITMTIISTMTDKMIVMMAMATGKTEAVMADTIDRVNATYCDESPTKCGSNLRLARINGLIFISHIDSIRYYYKRLCF